jgi:NadR type nicotinamide-nucleotide adenylyltransferase
VDSKKIVVIGPESTGKSTLSENLAKALATVWVPEHARTYIDLLNRPYDENDLLEIAKGQLDSEDDLLKQAGKYLICDTDLNVIKVWSEHKYGRCDSWILEQIAARKYDAYLLTDIDFEWADDPQREHSDPSMRQYFYDQYKDIVISSGLPWINIKGTHQERMDTALSFLANFR